MYISISSYRCIHATLQLDYMYLPRVEAAVHDELRRDGAVEISFVDAQRVKLGNIVTCDECTYMYIVHR